MSSDLKCPPLTANRLNGIQNILAVLDFHNECDWAATPCETADDKTKQDMKSAVEWLTQFAKVKAAKKAKAAEQRAGWKAIQAKLERERYGPRD